MMYCFYCNLCSLVLRFIVLIIYLFIYVWQKSMKKVIAVNRLAILAKKDGGMLSKDMFLEVWIL